jgi:hypothetical protein
MLYAVTHDANNKLLLLAFAHVPIENEDNWSWFLRNFKECCVDGAEIVFISDRDKCLIPAMETSLPEACYTYCSWHIAEREKIQLLLQAACVILL